MVPREWGQEWSSCNGQRQSPVLLLPHKSIGITLPRLHFKHFRSPLANPVIQNTGRTLRLKSSMPKPIISGGILTEEYVFEQADFHWGRDDHSGSEHIIDGNSYALEAQLLFKLRTPSARADCKVCPPAFVSVATQFQTTRHRNAELMTLVSSLSSVAYALDKSRPSLPIRLEALIPNDTDHYYMYDGSRTVPPCSEDVLWLAFRKSSYIGREQVDMNTPTPDTHLLSLWDRRTAALTKYRKHKRRCNLRRVTLLTKEASTYAQILSLTRWITLLRVLRQDYVARRGVANV
ncbi:hypothetical protein HPB47_012176 [Ixodes persulcatus]|uniref:Uncharacterized protein n=1 Tax=Ixodes persulcatus TaxID=34615 RepID=A0AC60NU91_IXOPE|nr:hypothetical protein HPB47_012176 [Ixodes persulcatus]